MSKEEMELHERVAKVEINVENVGKNVDKIMTNHLPHIQKAIDDANANIQSIKIRIAYWSGAIAVITVIAEYLINKYH